MGPRVRALVLVSVTALAVGGLAPPAAADSPVLIAENPAPDQWLDVDPSAVTLTFDQPLSVSSTITLSGPSGTCVQNSPVILPSAELSCLFVPEDLDDGTYTVTYVADPSSGSDPPTSGSYDFFLDTVAPPAPTEVSIAPDPYNTSSTTLTVTGTSEDDDATVAVEVTSGATTVSQNVDAGSGGEFTATFTALEVAGLADGTLTASARSTDLAGNQGPAGTDTATKDTVAPAAPTVDTPPAFANQANASAFPVSGTGEPGATVDVTVTGTSGSATGTATVAGNGTWGATVNVAGLPDGTLTVTATQTDGAGNLGPSSAPGTSTKDTSAPATPTTAISPDPVNAATQTAVTVSGTSNGSNVTVTMSDGLGGGADLTQTVPVSTGSYSATFNVTSLSDGTITASAVAVDAAGNSSAAGTDSATKDTVAPGTPSVVISPDPIGSANQGSVTVSGTSAGSSVTVTMSDGLGGGADLTQTVPVVLGSYSATFNVTSLSDGTIIATVVATDAAGNSSGPGTDTATKDTTAPGTPSVQISPDPVNAATQTAVTVSGTSNGSNVTVTMSDGPGGGANLTQTVPVSAGSYTATFNVSSLSDGTITASAVAVDGAGNSSAAGTDSATKDTVAPGTPSVVISPDPIGSANQGSVTVSGTSNGSTVDIVLGDGPGGGPNLTQDDVPVVLGSYSATFNVASLSDGTITATVVATDAAGNSSGPGTDTATKDTTAPGAPSVQISPDPVNAATQTAVTVSGTATGSNVTVTMSDGLGGGADLTQTVPVSAGSYSATFNVTSLSDGTITASAVAVDGAGNSSAAGTDSALLDTGAPAQPTAVSIANDPYNSASTTLSVSGTSENDDDTVQVQITSGAVTLTQTVDAGPGGAFTATFTQPQAATLPDGTLTAGARSSDVAGNQGALSSDTSVKDTVVPSRTSSSPVDGSRVLPPATVAVTFSETLASGSISIPGVAGSSSFSGSTVTFTPGSTFPEGDHTATATVTDLRGNPGSGTVSFIVDDGFATTSTTLNPIPAAVGYQAPITLAGQVARPDKSVPALPVAVFMRDDTGQTKQIALVTPSGSGAWSMLYRPTRNATFSATYLGDRKNAASTSEDRTTKVRVRIDASTKTGPASKKASVKGSVTPAKAGVLVQLYRVGKGKPKLLDTVKVKNGGRFTFRVRLAAGKTKLEIRIGATPGNLGSSVRLTAFRT